LLALILAAPAIQAKDKKPKAKPNAPQDEIAVIGHIPLTDGPVRRFLTTQHFSSYYLYVEHDAGKSVTLIDVTKATKPLVLADVAYPTTGGSDSLLAVAGTAALMTSELGNAADTRILQTIRIMDFSDPQRPKVAREFTGVTAISRDDRRGLIFVANSEGVWILQQHLADDPEVQKAYAHHVIYDH
jgi:hypothetical protein